MLTVSNVTSLILTISQSDVVSRQPYQNKDYMKILVRDRHQHIIEYSIIREGRGCHRRIGQIPCRIGRKRSEKRVISVPNHTR